MSWDDIWKGKKYVTDFSLRWHDFLLDIANLLPEGAKVLEAGCGSGEGLAVLKGHGRVLVGLDTSENAIARTLSHEGLSAVRGDNAAMPFPEDTFDLVFNSGVIEHYKYPENLRHIEEMSRVAKPGGYVIINVPNSLCFWYIAAKNILSLIGKWEFGYEESYTPHRLRKTAEEAGLEVIRETGFLAIPPFATNRTELLPVGIRKRLSRIEKHLPMKQYYCYSVCVVCRKG